MFHKSQSFSLLNCNFSSPNWTQLYQLKMLVSLTSCKLSFLDRRAPIDMLVRRTKNFSLDGRNCANRAVKSRKLVWRATFSRTAIRGKISLRWGNSKGHLVIMNLSTFDGRVSIYFGFYSRNLGYSFFVARWSICQQGHVRSPIKVLSCAGLQCFRANFFLFFLFFGWPWVKKANFRGIMIVKPSNDSHPRPMISIFLKFLCYFLVELWVLLKLYV